MTIALALILNLAAAGILLVLLTKAMRLPYRFTTASSIDSPTAPVQYRLAHRRPRPAGRRAWEPRIETEGL